MKLLDILEGLEYECEGNLDKEIFGIENNSQNINTGDMFVCIKGFKVDGHKYINSAIEKGAKAIIIQDDIDLNNIPNDVSIIKTEDSRLALAICSCNFYNNPSKKFTLIGVTGTKGKTTTTYIIKSILEAAGKRVGLIGTIENNIAGEKIENAHRTTPESIELQKLFNKMIEKKVEYVIMEVSSQALKLNRVAGCDFDIGVFTNFSEDHISPNEHPTMEDYLSSKLKLFEMCKKGFVNADIEEAKKIKQIAKCPLEFYSIENSSDLKAQNIEITNTTANFSIEIDNKEENFKINIPGKFSVYNSLAAISAVNSLKIDIANIKEGLEKVKVPGRSELVENDLDFTIIIDYAHSPDSLKNILTAVKAYTKGRLISVFGCGGDRDSKKRPMMGKISGEIADITIITSDNPRTEEPEKIVKQIEEGINTTNGVYELIVDRKEAIERAIRIAKKEDIIVLAGKGHETYQEINGKYIDFDERIVIKQILNEIKIAL